MRACVIRFVLVVLAAAMPLDADACSCVRNGNVIESLLEADVVFVGEVIRTGYTLEDWEPRRVVQFDVWRSWKGPTTGKVRLTTGLGGGDCGYGFESGHVYLVYAYSGLRGALETSICTRTQQLAGLPDEARTIDAARRGEGFVAYPNFLGVLDEAPDREALVESCQSDAPPFDALPSVAASVPLTRLSMSHHRGWAAVVRIDAAGAVTDASLVVGRIRRGSDVERDLLAAIRKLRFLPHPSARAAGPACVGLVGLESSS